MFDIFLVTPAGLEFFLSEEAQAKGFTVTDTIPGGVTVRGDWPDVWRANLELRGATRVLARLAHFRAMHLAQLDRRARKLAWDTWFKPEIPIKVEATCRKSKIYHQKAAAQRVATALQDTLGVTIADTAPLTLKLRIEDDLCTFSVDTSGPALHQRGLKQQVNKAPMRETLAAMFLRACGYDGTTPLYDPMCGSGTFPIEAAEIAMNLQPGRARDFAFQQLQSYDPDAFAQLTATRRTPSVVFFGSDRDAGAIKMSQANAQRAGIEHLARFETKPISDILPPTDRPGLVIVNPPYGGRVGNKKPLFGLYATFGRVMTQRFKGWRVGLITSEASLAKATALPFQPPGPFVDHGGIKVRLWQTDPL